MAYEKQVSVIGDEGHHDWAMPDWIDAGQIIEVQLSEWACDAMYCFMRVKRSFEWKKYCTVRRAMRADHETYYPPFRAHVRYSMDIGKLLEANIVELEKPAFWCTYLDREFSDSSYDARHDVPRLNG